MEMLIKALNICENICVCVRVRVYYVGICDLCIE